MTEFKSRENTMHVSAKAVYDKLADLSNLKEMLKKVPEDKIPADKREMFDSLKIDKDSIEIQGGPTGSIRLQVAERREPELIRLKADNVPIDIYMSLHIHPVSDTECRTQVVLEADIPVFLKPMVSGPMQKVVDEFEAVLSASC